jgi:hypothetical protein
MNVYYLPGRHQAVTDTPDVFLRASRWSVLRARGHRAWWRLRLTVREIIAVIRRGGASDRLEDHVWFFDDEPPVAPRRRARGPARIIALDTARQRRPLHTAST